MQVFLVREPRGNKKAWLLVGEAASLTRQRDYEEKLGQLEADLVHVQGTLSTESNTLHPLAITRLQACLIYF